MLHTYLPQTCILHVCYIHTYMLAHSAGKQPRLTTAQCRVPQGPFRGPLQSLDTVWLYSACWWKNTLIQEPVDRRDSLIHTACWLNNRTAYNYTRNSLDISMKVDRCTNRWSWTRWVLKGGKLQYLCTRKEVGMGIFAPLKVLTYLPGWHCLSLQSILLIT